MYTIIPKPTQLLTSTMHMLPSHHHQSKSTPLSSNELTASPHFSWKPSGSIRWLFNASKGHHPPEVLCPGKTTPVKLPITPPGARYVASLPHFYFHKLHMSYSQAPSPLKSTSKWFIQFTFLTSSFLQCQDIVVSWHGFYNQWLDPGGISLGDHIKDSCQEWAGKWVWRKHWRWRGDGAELVRLLASIAMWDNCCLQMFVNFDVVVCWCGGTECWSRTEIVRVWKVFGHTGSVFGHTCGGSFVWIYTWVALAHLLWDIVNGVVERLSRPCEVSLYVWD